MTFHDYLLKNLKQTVMIELSIDDTAAFQYNYWNWLHQVSELHLLRDDFSLGHILYCGEVVLNDDGSIVCQSKYFPKTYKMNFYFGGSN